MLTAILPVDLNADEDVLGNGDVPAVITIGRRTKTLGTPRAIDLDRFDETREVHTVRSFCGLASCARRRPKFTVLLALGF